METLKDILEVLQSLSIVGALIYAVIFLYNQNQSMLTSRNSVRLSNWKEISALLQEDARLREKILVCLDRIENSGALKLDSLRTKYVSGKRAYLSSELAEFRDIARHYEHMGASIRLGYLPLELLNEVVPFPDEFWDKTAYLRAFLKDNWFGPGKALEAFLQNFGWMRDTWHKRR